MRAYPTASMAISESSHTSRMRYDPHVAMPADTDLFELRIAEANTATASKQNPLARTEVT